MQKRKKKERKKENRRKEERQRRRRAGKESTPARGNPIMFITVNDQTSYDTDFEFLSIGYHTYGFLCSNKSHKSI